MGIKMTNYLKGSEWRKWDLQVHTPLSCLSNGFGNNFDEYVKKLFKTAIEKKVASIGITDYFCIEGYKKIKQEYIENVDKLRELFTGDEIRNILDILIIPNIEFRLNKLVGTNRINFHVLFSDEISINDIEENFLREIKFVYEGNPQNEDEERALTIANLESLGQGLKREHAHFNDKTDMFVGMMNAVVDDSAIVKILVNRQSIFKDKFLLFVPSDEDLSSINWNGQDHNVRKVIIQKSDGLFASNQNTIKWGLGHLSSNQQEYIDEFKSLKPCIWSSDAHEFDKLFEPDEQRYTWIKADPTFEGLKQIIYEPEDRVIIQENKPAAPVRHISQVQLSFDIDTKIKLIKEKEDIDADFCFAEMNKPLCLSDYFTCFIGGRGTGKSTLLNLIYKAFDPSAKMDFFSKNKITVDGNNVDILECVQLENTANSVEFLEQNQIEKFATDQVEFTKAIYVRLKGKENGIESLEEELLNSLTVIDEQIERLLKKGKLKQAIQQSCKDYEAAKKIIDIVETVEYKKITDSIQELNKEYLLLKNDRGKIESLNEEIQAFLENHHKFDLTKDSTRYKESYNEFLGELEKLSSRVLNEENFETESTKEKDLLGAIESNQKVLEDYLGKQGLSEENLQDVKIAGVRADENEIIKDEKKKELVVLENQISDFDISNIYEVQAKYDDKVIDTIKELKQVLDEVNRDNPDVDKIDLRFGFNEVIAKKKLFEEFMEMFKDYCEEIKYSESRVKDCLFGISPFEILKEEKGYDDIKTAVKGQNNYNLLLENVFENELNYEIYRLQVQKHFYNSVNYLKIDVLYRGKPIKQASFGQKCTAVIVIMLLFGHNPIIIDEPEAHLDSSLIANYLVNLVKKEKVKRQIIFATHNANFVINADAEQIYILEMPEKQTEFIQTTIENLDERERLLKLEGGEKAFSKREMKYGFR